MKLCDKMVKGIVMYGVEIWGWKEQKELEKVQGKYIKWVLEKETPAYMFMLDTGRDRIEIQAAKRIVGWEKN